MERDVFLSAYTVRKLMEADKLSDELESSSLRALKYLPRDRTVDIINAGTPLNESGPMNLPRDRTVDIMNWHKIDELYDISSHVVVSVGLRQFCNQVVHSFVFSLSMTARGGLDGFFVASDHTKDRQLLYFSIDAVVNTLLRVADDDIVSLRMSREAIGKPMKVTRKSNTLESAT